MRLPQGGFGFAVFLCETLSHKNKKATGAHQYAPVAFRLNKYDLLYRLNCPPKETFVILATLSATKEGIEMP
jgi:hypothetical protein